LAPSFIGAGLVVRVTPRALPIDTCPPVGRARAGGGRAAAV
jgi:hypothetical protein